MVLLDAAAGRDADLDDDRAAVLPQTARVLRADREALAAAQLRRLLDLQGMQMVINYGTNKVRFPSPLKAGDNYRLAIRIADVTDKAKGWVEAIFVATIEVEGQDKPACVAECVYRFLPA